MSDEKKNGTPPNLDFTNAIASHEAEKGKERNAYEAVLIAAAGVDMDRDSLFVRADRIAKEARDLAEEALRVRDQHEMQISALQAEAQSHPVVTVLPPVAVTQSVVLNHVPPTLVHWIRRQIALHPLGSDRHPVLVEPNVTLGELRAFLSAYDGGNAS